MANSAAAVVPSAADSVADFYKGQELTILIGHPPGGSYDLYAQLAAAHMGKFIPGHPTVIVQSMPSWAGSKAGAYFYNKAPHDGSIISLFPETIAYVQLMDPVQGKWDVTRMSYIGSFAPVNTAFMLRKDAPAKTAQDIFKVRTNVGCSGRTSQSYQYPAIMKALAGMNLNIICGYDGSSSYTLALLRGEVDIVSKAWNAWRAVGLLDAKAHLMPSACGPKGQPLVVIKNGNLHYRLPWSLDDKNPSFDAPTTKLDEQIGRYWATPPTQRGSSLTNRDGPVQRRF